MKTDKKPNIIFIMSDQHNAKVLGHKGHPDVITPNLDKMAKEGVRFNNAISQNPICTPSRVSWLSGQYCHNHGYYGMGGPNPDGLQTILGHFRRNGYTTAAIGKIHCPDYWVEDDCDYFEEIANCSIGGNPDYTSYLEGKGILDLMDWRYIHGFGKKGKQSCDARASELTYRDTAEGYIVSRSFEFMDKVIQDEGKPFILHVSFPKPHQCYVPTSEFWNMYDEDKLTLPPNIDYDMKDKAPHMIKSAQKWRTGDWTLFEPRTYEAGRLRKLHGYLGCISQVDYAVGEIMQWIEEKGIAEDTIVIYSSDHGDYACEHGIMEKAPGICSDAITRIPFIWKWKDHFKEGHVANEIVESVDMAAAMCSLAGIDELESVDGKDISPLLYGEEKQTHKIGVTEFVWSKSVRKGKYRFVYYPDDMFLKDYPDGFGELYDIENDPWEMKNLYFDKTYHEIVNELKGDLLEWIITTTRPRTTMLAEPRSRYQNYQRIESKKRENSDGKINPERIRRSDIKYYT